MQYIELKSKNKYKWIIRKICTNEKIAGFHDFDRFVNMSDSITIPDWLTLWFPVRPVGSVMFLKHWFTVLIHLIHLGLKSFFYKNSLFSKFSKNNNCFSITIFERQKEVEEWRLEDSDQRMRWNCEIQKISVCPLNKLAYILFWLLEYWILYFSLLLIKRKSETFGIYLKNILKNL
jgi:hypothetical protein